MFRSPNKSPVTGLMEITYYAARDIRAGEELTGCCVNTILEDLTLNGNEAPGEDSMQHFCDFYFQNLRDVDGGSPSRFRCLGEAVTSDSLPIYLNGLIESWKNIEMKPPTMGMTRILAQRTALLLKDVSAGIKCTSKTTNPKKGRKEVTEVQPPEGRY